MKIIVATLFFCSLAWSVAGEPPPQRTKSSAILFKVEDDALHAVGKLDELRLLGGFEAVDAGDVVADLDDGPDLVFVQLGREVRDLLFEDSRDFVSVDHLLVFPLGSLVLRKRTGKVVQTPGDCAVDAAVVHRDAHAADQRGIDPLVDDEALIIELGEALDQRVHLVA